MKKTILNSGLWFLTILCISLIACSKEEQQIESNIVNDDATVLAKSIASTSVPSAVLTAFTTGFPNASNVKWDENKGNYKAEFADGGKIWEATYDINGKLLKLQSSTSVTTTTGVTIPAAVSISFDTDFPGATSIQWALSALNFKVECQWNGNKWEAIYDPNGVQLKKQMATNTTSGGSGTSSGSGSGGSSTTTTITVPAAVTVTFNTDFPGATGVKWSMKNSDYKVECQWNNNKWEAIYTASGVLVKKEVATVTTSTIAVPTAVMTSFNTDFPSATGVKWSMKNSDYKVQCTWTGNKWEAIYALNGTLIKKEKK